MRRGLAVLVCFAAVAVALLFPLFSQFGSAFPHDAGDPVLNTWILWHESRHLPLSHAWWNGPIFYPAPDTLAFSEVLLSLLPLSALVQALTHNPIAAYNAVFVATFPLCGLAMYLLARDLAGRVDAAVVAGLAFMLAPYRAEQLAHVQVLAYFWTPLVLLGLHRYVSQGRRRWLVLFAAAWLAQSLANGYAMFHVSILVILWMVWFVRPVRRWLPIVTAWGIAALPMVPILLRYETVHWALHLTRDVNEVRRFGIDIGDLLAAPPDLLIWGNRLGLARPETAVFPGITLVVLAMAALYARRREAGASTSESSRPQRILIAVSAVAALVAFSVFIVGPWRVGPLSVRDFHKPFSIAVGARLLAFLSGPWTRRMWRERSLAGFYLLATLAMYLLALGPEPRLLGRPLLYEPPYAWLMRLPGFDTLRVPARFVMVAAICQSVLVALAVVRWGNGRRRTLIVTAIVAGLAVDGWFRLPVAAAPAAGPPASNDVAALIELPLGDPSTDFGAMFRQMAHQKPIVNGFSGYLPPFYVPLERTLRAGRYEVLHEIAPEERLGVVVDRRRADARDMEGALARAGIAPVAHDDRWATFVVSPQRRPSVRAGGARLTIAHVSASRHPEDVGRMLDGNITTAWGTELGQTGGEEVVVDTGAPHGLGTLVLGMGAFAFGHPAGLEVDVSSDRTTWSPAWRGEPGVLAVRGAIVDPGIAPIVLDLGGANGRYVRLRQIGAEPTIPWWIAELTLTSD
jgi:hypothetical protein